jgi:hypothetical protein
MMLNYLILLELEMVSLMYIDITLQHKLILKAIPQRGSLFSLFLK